MPTIEQLPKASSIGDGDQLAIYSKKGGGTRRTAVSDIAQAVRKVIEGEPDETVYTVTNTVTVLPVKPGGNVWAQITLAAAVPSFTIILPGPAERAHGQEVLVTCTQDVTALNVSGQDAALRGAPTTIAKNGSFRLRYDAVSNTWVQIASTLTVAALAGGGGSSLIGFLQSGALSILRSIQDKLRDSLSVRDFGAKGDGITDDQAAIEAAIAEALAKGKSLRWPAGTYVSSANIVGFHDVPHFGSGAIKRGTDLFYVEPRGAQTSILYVGPASLNVNDGLGAGQPATISQAFARILALGRKAADGQWRIQFLPGTYTSGGQTFYSAPYFTRPLQIWGSRDGAGNVQVAWDGATSTAKYAFRADGNSGALNVSFKDLKFKNWNGDPTNAGAIVCWYGVNVMTEDCEFEACTIAVWCRGGYSRHYGDKITGPGAWGYGFQYGHSGQVGSSSRPVTVSGVGIGVFCARESVAHVDYTTLSGNAVNLQLHQKSRVATVGSSFSTWSDVSMWLQGDSIYEDSTDVGSNFDAASITDATPIYRLDNGSSVPAVHNGPLPYRVAHYCPASTFSLTGTTTATLLSGQTGFGAPLRMPKNMLFNTGTLQVRIECRLDMAGSGSTKRVALYGPGSSVAYEIGYIDIPAGGGLGKLYIDVDFRPNGTALFMAEYKSNNATLNTVRLATVSSSVVNMLRDATGDAALWRLYGTLANAADTLSLSSITTHVRG